MAVEDECKLKFLELKAKRNYRFIIFRIDGQQVVVEKLGSPEENYDDFSNSLPANECRYAVYDFDFTTAENCQKSKIFFIAWYFTTLMQHMHFSCYKTFFSLNNMHYVDLNVWLHNKDDSTNN